MPFLFSLGMHPALVAAQRRLRPSERIFAFLDDVCVVCLPERVQTVVNILAAELWAHAQIQVHHGKTQVWNRVCEEPAGMEELTARARVVDPEAVVWRGDTSLDPTMRGLKVLGAPIGSDEFVRAQLEVTVTKHATLLQRIPALRDLQSAWLLLLFCAAPRANFHLRMATPTVRGFSRKPTTTRCGRVSANWLGLQVAQKVLAGQLVSPLTWEGWDCVSLQGVLRLPIGPVGPIAFPV